MVWTRGLSVIKASEGVKEGAGSVGAADTSQRKSGFQGADSG